MNSELESGASSEAESVSAVSLTCATPAVTRESPVKKTLNNLASPRPKRWLKHFSAGAAQDQDLDGAQYLLENVPNIKDEFDIISKIGEGTFSSVFLASLKGCPEEKFALKHLIPTSSSSRIENELKCLQMMGGRDNVIPIHACVRHKDHIVLIMPYFPHDKFSDYLPHMTVSEAREYMRALLLALRNVHSHHIIHRDIKPSNFLYNRTTKQFQLVDFGLAHLESSRQDTPTTKETILLRSKSRGSTSASATQDSRKPRTVANGIIPPHTYQRQIHQRMVAKTAKQSSDTSRSKSFDSKQNGTGKLGGGHCSVEEIRLCPLRHKVTEVCDFCMSRSNQTAPRAGTPGFRAPEVLLKCPSQTTAVDIWSAGVILLCVLSGRYPFFKAHDDLSAMAQIISLMGSKQCTEAARMCGKELVCVPEIPPTDLKALCVALRSGIPSNQLSDCEVLPSPVKKSRLCNGEVVDSNITCKSPIARTRKSPRKSVSGNSPWKRKQTVSHGTDNSVISSMDCVSNSWDNVPDSAYSLLHRCLDFNPASRITAEEALQHPFVTDYSNR